MSAAYEWEIIFFLSVLSLSFCSSVVFAVHQYRDLFEAKKAKNPDGIILHRILAGIGGADSLWGLLLLIFYFMDTGTTRKVWPAPHLGKTRASIGTWSDTVFVASCLWEGALTVFVLCKMRSHLRTLENPQLDVKCTAWSSFWLNFIVVGITLVCGLIAQIVVCLGVQRFDNTKDFGLHFGQMAVVFISRFSTPLLLYFCISKNSVYRWDPLAITIRQRQMRSFSVFMICWTPQAILETSVLRDTGDDEYTITRSLIATKTLLYLLGLGRSVVYGLDQRALYSCFKYFRLEEYLEENGISESTVYAQQDTQLRQPLATDVTTVTAGAADTTTAKTTMMHTTATTAATSMTRATTTTTTTTTAATSTSTRTANGMPISTPDLPVYLNEPPLKKPVLVNTDIQGSTRLWQACPTAMEAALDLHDQVLRRAMIRYRGYEITTEGDAFRIAFHHCSDAMMWCVDVQLRLVRETWPAELLALDDARVVRDAHGETIFNGLRVRMGVFQAGTDLVCTVHSITHKTTYHGPSAEMALGIGDDAIGGQILVSDKIWKKSQVPLNKMVPADGRLVGPWSMDIREAVTVQLYSVVPKALAGRQAVFYPSTSSEASVASFSM